MNINRDEFYKKVKSTFGSPNTIMSYLDLCKIKPLDCAGCGHANPDEDHLLTCMSCVRRTDLKDNYQPKASDLSKLFIGAPVVVINDPAITDSPKLEYYNQTHHFKRNQLIRLPTVEESPRNTWLAPWLKMPDELNGKLIAIRFEDFSIVTVPTVKYCSDSWNLITAIQIMEDFKK